MAEANRKFCVPYNCRTSLSRCRPASGRCRLRMASCPPSCTRIGAHVGRRWGSARQAAVYALDAREGPKPHARPFASF